MDSIVQARQQVYANFHMREDRLVAINILATHWRNQRKTFVKRRKELASAETDKECLNNFCLMHAHEDSSNFLLSLALARALLLPNLNLTLGF